MVRGVAFQPSIDERQVKELASLALLKWPKPWTSRNGPCSVPSAGTWRRDWRRCCGTTTRPTPGVGKTHLAVALAKRAIEHGYGAYFWTSGPYDLMEDLRKARAEPVPDLRAPGGLAPRGCYSTSYHAGPEAAGLLVLAPKVLRPGASWTSSASGPTTGTRDTATAINSSHVGVGLSTRYACPELAEGSGAASSSRPTRASASGANSWATR